MQSTDSTAEWSWLATTLGKSVDCSELLSNYVVRCRLINQVANEIWECRDGDIHKWQGDILSYKDHLIEHMNDENVNMAQSADNKKIIKSAPKKVAPIKVKNKITNPI